MEIFPSVFLGDRSYAADLAWLRKEGITAVVNVTSEVKNYFEFKASQQRRSFGRVRNASAPDLRVVMNDLLEAAANAVPLSSNSQPLNDTSEDAEVTPPLPRQSSMPPTSASLETFLIKQEEESANQVKSEPVDTTEATSTLPTENAVTEPQTENVEVKKEEESEEQKMDIIYKRIGVSDSEEINIIKYFDEAAKFIDENVQKGGKVLIHCNQGQSRSPSILIAYAMTALKMDLATANEVVTTSSEASPLIKKIDMNRGFRKQLMDYELMLNKGVNTLDFFEKKKRIAAITRFMPSNFLEEQQQNKLFRQLTKSNSSDNLKKKENESNALNVQSLPRKEKKKKSKDSKKSKEKSKKSSKGVIDSKQMLITSSFKVIVKDQRTNSEEEKSQSDELLIAKQETKSKRKNESEVEENKKKKCKADKNLATEDIVQTPPLPTKFKRSTRTSLRASLTQDDLTVNVPIAQESPKTEKLDKEKSKPKKKDKNTEKSKKAANETTEKTEKEATPKKQAIPKKSNALTLNDLIEAGVFKIGDQLEFRNRNCSIAKGGILLYGKEQFTSMSKWATHVIRTTGGSKNSAVNGWRCNSVRHNVTLSDIRERYLKGDFEGLLAGDSPASTNVSSLASQSTSNSTTETAQSEKDEQSTTQSSEDTTSNQSEKKANDDSDIMAEVSDDEEEPNEESAESASESESDESGYSESESESESEEESEKEVDVALSGNRAYESDVESDSELRSMPVVSISSPSRPTQPKSLLNWIDQRHDSDFESGPESEDQLGYSVVNHIQDGVHQHHSICHNSLPYLHNYNHNSFGWSGSNYEPLYNINTNNVTIHWSQIEPAYGVNAAEESTGFEESEMEVTGAASQANSPEDEEAMIDVDSFMAL